MATTQSTRQTELITPLGPDKLLFHQMVAHEGVSQLFDYDMVVLSEDENIVLSDLVGQHAHVELELPHDDTRYFCGHVTRFSFLGFQGNFAKYKVKLRPWLWLLTRTHNNRIFQNKTVPEIIKEVCADHGFSDIDDRLTDSYDPRVFCVQYRESDFDFISRLMEDEGIYYFFIHEAGKHDLVLADGISSHAPYGDYAVVPWFPPDEHDRRERDHLDHWELSQSVRSGKYALRDYNFETPKANLEAKSQIIRPIEHAEYEVYDYPGKYDDFGQGEAFARKRMEELQADFEVMHGSGNARGMQPGFLFELENHSRNDQNREYLILAVTHDVWQDAYETRTDRFSDSFNYGCSLQAMPSSEPYRPARTTVKPIVHGPQTAVVVGDAGEEIWTDEYGRVKVEFHWDRLDQKNENSSCWLRVSQSWAGKKWGAQFLPRIGQEVIVEFLEGDPDRPIVTGAVYNADNKPPYDLPANATQSGIKTRSSKGGNADNFNEIRFEDLKGSEQLYIHAEKDMDTVVENCQTQHVWVNRTTSVGKDEKMLVKGDREREVNGNEDVTIDGNWTQKVNGFLDLDVTSHIKQISTGLDVTSRTGIDVNAAISISETAGANIDSTAGAMINMTAGAGINLTAGGPITMMAGGLITMMSPPGVKTIHNDDTNIGLGKSVLESFKNEVVTTFTDAKILSTGIVGTSMSTTGVSMSVTGLSIQNNSKTIKPSQMFETDNFTVRTLNGVLLIVNSGLQMNG